MPDSDPLRQQMTELVQLLATTLTTVGASAAELDAGTALVVLALRMDHAADQQLREAQRLAALLALRARHATWVTDVDEGLIAGISAATVAEAARAARECAAVVLRRSSLLSEAARDDGALWSAGLAPAEAAGLQPYDPAGAALQLAANAAPGTALAAAELLDATGQLSSTDGTYIDTSAGCIAVHALPQPVVSGLQGSASTTFALEVLGEHCLQGSAREVQVLPAYARALQQAGLLLEAHRSWCRAVSVMFSTGCASDSLEALEMAESTWAEARDADLSLPLQSPWLTAALANRARFGGALSDALRLGREAAAALQLTGDLRGAVKSLTSLSVVLDKAGEVEEAEASRRRAGELARRLGDENLRASVLNSYAILSEGEGAASSPHLGYEEQAAMLEQVVEIRERSGDSRGLSLALNNLAVLHGQHGNHSASYQALHRSLALRRESGDRRGEAMTLLNLATLLNEMRDFAAALALGTEARQSFAAIGELYGEARALLCLAMSYLELALTEEALEHAAASVQLSRDSGYQVDAGESLLVLARACELAGRLPEAKEHTEEALSLLTGSGRREAESRACLELARMRARDGEDEAAVALLERTSVLARYLDEGRQSELHALAAQLKLPDVCPVGARL